MPNHNTKKQSTDYFFKYTGMAFQLFAGIFIGVWGGIKLDALLNTHPWFTVMLSLLGVAAGMYAVLKDFIKATFWLEKSANQGDANGQFHLGHCYENGIGVLKDFNKESIEWVEREVEQYLKTK